MDSFTSSTFDVLEEVNSIIKGFGNIEQNKKDREKYIQEKKSEAEFLCNELYKILEKISGGDAQRSVSDITLNNIFRFIQKISSDFNFTIKSNIITKTLERSLMSRAFNSQDLKPIANYLEILDGFNLNASQHFGALKVALLKKIDEAIQLQLENGRISKYGAYNIYNILQHGKNTSLFQLGNSRDEGILTMIFERFEDYFIEQKNNPHREIIDYNIARALPNLILYYKTIFGVEIGSNLEDFIANSTRIEHQGTISSAQIKVYERVKKYLLTSVGASDGEAWQHIPAVDEMGNFCIGDYAVKLEAPYDNKDCAWGDIVIYRKQEAIAVIEFDGPKHFCNIDDEVCLTGTTLSRNRLLTAMNLDFIVITEEDLPFLSEDFFNNTFLKDVRHKLYDVKTSRDSFLQESEMAAQDDALGACSESLRAVSSKKPEPKKPSKKHKKSTKSAAQSVVDRQAPSPSSEASARKIPKKIKELNQELLEMLRNKVAVGEIEDFMAENFEPNPNYFDSSHKKANQAQISKEVVVELIEMAAGYANWLDIILLFSRYKHQDIVAKDLKCQNQDIRLIAMFIFCPTEFYSQHTSKTKKPDNLRKEFKETKFDNTEEYIKKFFGCCNVLSKEDVGLSLIKSAILGQENAFWFLACSNFEISESEEFTNNLASCAQFCKNVKILEFIYYKIRNPKVQLMFLQNIAYISIIEFNIDLLEFVAKKNIDILHVPFVVADFGKEHDKKPEIKDLDHGLSEVDVAESKLVITEAKKFLLSHPLSLAAKFGDGSEASCQILRFLLDKGVDPNGASFPGATPLEISCRKANQRFVEILLQNSKIDPDSPSTDQQVNLVGNLDWLEIIIKGIVRDQLIELKRIFKKIKEKPQNRISIPCSAAIFSGDVQLLEMLLKKSADPNQQFCLRDDRRKLCVNRILTPLTAVAGNRNHDAARLLLANGAKNFLGVEGEVIPLVSAFHIIDPIMVKILIEGMTPKEKAVILLGKDERSGKSTHGRGDNILHYMEYAKNIKADTMLEIIGMILEIYPNLLFIENSKKVTPFNIIEKLPVESFASEEDFLKLRAGVLQITGRKMQDVALAAKPEEQSASDSLAQDAGNTAFLKQMDQNQQLSTSVARRSLGEGVGGVEPQGAEVVKLKAVASSAEKEIRGL